MKNVLYLSYDGLADPLGQSQIIPYLEGLALKGQWIHIISFEKKRLFNSSKQKINDKLTKTGIQWHPYIYHKSPPILSTLWNILQMWQAAKKLHNENSFQIVHCRSYIASIVGFAMKRKYKTKFLFDMRGFWADERIDGGLWNLGNPLFNIIYKYFKKQERAFLENADAIVSLTHLAKDEINSWGNRNLKAPIYVIPCCVDLDLFSRDLIESKRLQIKKKELNIESNDFILTYLGSIGTWYMLDEMLDFFKILLQTKNNTKFLFISADQNVIMQKADSKNIPRKNIIVYKAERKEVPLLLALTNLSIFFIKPVYSKKASSPTKQGELMAMGVPIICNGGVGDTEEIINKFNAGKIVEGFCPASYKQVVDNIDHIAALDSKPIIEGAYQTYSLGEAVLKYSYIYDYLLQSNINS